VYADPPADEAESTAAYYRRLGREAIQALVRIGLPACSGGIMASNPRWCQPLSVWTRYFRQWMDHPACLVGRALVGHTVGFDLDVLARVRGVPAFRTSPSTPCGSVGRCIPRGAT
jgi:CBS domain-containing protein